jgi:hypothetical protein
MCQTLLHHLREIQFLNCSQLMSCHRVNRNRKAIADTRAYEARAPGVWVHVPRPHAARASAGYTRCIVARVASKCDGPCLPPAGPCARRIAILNDRLASLGAGLGLCFVT